MFRRNVLALCALALFLAVVSVSAQEPQLEELESLNVQLQNEVDEFLDSAIETRNAFTKKVLKILEKAFKGIAKHCLDGAAQHCKKYWYNPPKAISCATDWLAGGCM